MKWIGCGCIIVLCLIALMVLISTDNSDDYYYDYDVGDSIFVEPTYTKIANEFSVTDPLKNKTLYIKIVGLRPSNTIEMKVGKSYLVEIHNKRSTGNNHYYVTPHIRE